MKKILLYSVLTTTLATSAAQAVELTGGYLDLGYSTFTDSNLGDKLNFNGSGELAFSKAFSTQLDLGAYRFPNQSENGTSWTLHANLHTNSNASFGAFYGRDYVNGPDLAFYGIEAGFDAGPAEVEGYLGRQEVVGSSGFDGALFGISVVTDINDQWQFNASYDLLDNVYGVLDYNLFSIGANYAVSGNAEIYGTLGTAHVTSPIVSGSTNEAYVGIGVRVNLGNERGATFGRRGVLTKLPGL